MAGFLDLLRGNRNYRRMWTGQVVSEVGDHFNNIAVFSLALANTGSGLVVTGVMLSRAIPAVLAGPLAGVLLDRLDRKRIMIASDLIRAVVALGFIGTLYYRSSWLLYVLSGLLMFASPFFTSGRASILPTIASREELRVPGRDRGDALRLPLGLLPERAFVFLFGLVYLAAASSRRELSRRAQGAHRGRSGASLA
jgi:MFS family permease